jgi:cell wall assembly regulator SMI1
MSGSAGELQKALEAVDQTLKKVRPQVHPLLRPGADAKELEYLAQEVFGGRTVPEELRVWFAWHDGQKRYESLTAWALDLIKVLEKAGR